MGKIQTISILGQTVTWYGLCACLLSAAGVVAAAILFHKKRGWKTVQAVLLCLTAAFLGLLLGRGIYCAIRSDMFEDAMGRPLGMGPFFDPNVGSVSVIGVIGGALLAAWLWAKAKKETAGAVLDGLALPGLFLFFALRLIEPLSGQGYGPLLETRALCWVPMGMQNGWGDWSLSVCFVEAALLLVIFVVLSRSGFQKPGTLALCALTLLATCQVVPESLRRDNVLRIFTFARVTQIGYAVIIFASALAAWVRGGKRGLARKTIFAEAGLVLLGILLLIAGEFALDKTQWPDAAIYAVMLAILALMTYLILRRIIAEDRRQ